MTLYNLADYRARRLRSRAVPLHIEALAAYEQAEAYRARHLASAHVCGWGESSESDGPAAAPPWPPATTLVPSNQPTPEGVAIPHVRLEQVKSPSGIMVRLKDPIDFNAVDEQPVDLVCLLLLLSKENESAQLKALAGVARRLRRRAQSSCTLQSLDQKNRSVSVAVK